MSNDEIPAEMYKTRDGRFELCKKFLNEEERVNDSIHSHSDIGVIPITHNPDIIILQMSGWSINLNKDGTWYWEGTDGG